MYDIEGLDYVLEELIDKGDVDWTIEHAYIIDLNLIVFNRVDLMCQCLVSLLTSVGLGRSRG